MKKLTLGLLTTTWLIAGFLASAATISTPRAYSSDAKQTIQIGSDLYDSLDNKYRVKFVQPPVSTTASAKPEMALIEKNDNGQAACQLAVSAGFIDLINHIAHAKAVDKIQPGYFSQYMTTLSTGVSAPAIAQDRYWTDDVMNDQASYFNQMMGMTIAINLSRHYLGQYDKHAGQMPLNDYLTESEWDKGVRAGAVNSLNCAFGTEGAKALFDAIGQMPQRPTWTAYIVPQKVDIKRLNKQLAKYEVDFFHGQLN
jgi:hypothetical protein